jgi:hypothetical protein
VTSYSEWFQPDNYTRDGFAWLSGPSAFVEDNNVLYGPPRDTFEIESGLNTQIARVEDLPTPTPGTGSSSGDEIIRAAIAATVFPAQPTLGDPFMVDANHREFQGWVVAGSSRQLTYFEQNLMPDPPTGGSVIGWEWEGGATLSAAVACDMAATFTWWGTHPDNGPKTVPSILTLSTAPATDYTSASGDPTPWVQEGVNSGQSPFTRTFSLDADQLSDDGNGGVMLVPTIEQATPWKLNEPPVNVQYTWIADVRILPGDLSVTWTLKPPRLRWVFAEDVPPEPPATVAVTRQFPRDDPYGFDASPRIYPDPKAASRIVGGYL